MRFKSSEVGGYRVFAVSGVNTVSFAIDASEADASGLLGFAVEREDPTENERYFMPGFKVFPEIVPNPDENTKVLPSTRRSTESAPQRYVSSLRQFGSS